MTATQPKKSGKEKIKEEIAGYMRAGYPVLYLCTPEEQKTMEIVREIAQETGRSLYVHDACEGLQCVGGEDRRLSIPGEASKRVALQSVFTYAVDNLPKRAFVVLKDPHTAFESDRTAGRAFKNCIANVDHKAICFLIVSSSLFVCPEVEKETVVFEIPFPTREEILEMVKEVAEAWCDTPPSDEMLDRITEALNGLTENEIRHLVHYCVQDDNELNEDDLRTINRQKKQITRASAALEFIDTAVGASDVGGLEELKAWLERKGKIFEQIEKAEESGVDLPKGVLLAGMPGCGKSLAAKAIAAEMKMPLLRLDMGAVMGPYVGQSEENLRKAIRLAEAVAPSVLWIDEIEKALAGANAGGGGSETTIRILGKILTWMQEKTAPVFIVATANNVSSLPPEFLRKGRFDENFFVDLPSVKEAAEIFRIHLQKRKQGEALTAGEIEAIAKKSDGFSGADIEAVVKEVVEGHFIAGGEKPISAKDFEEVMRGFHSISKMMPKEIEAMRKTLKEYHFKSATK